MNFIWLGLAGGALGCAHCLGMCGGFALHLARGGRPIQALGRQLLWHAGKTASYAFLGALAGFAGSRLLSWPGFPAAQNVLSAVAGAVMTVMGLTLAAAPLPFRQSPSQRGDNGIFATLYLSVFEQPGRAGALGLGLVTGFLPCPVVLALLAYAAQSGSVAAGVLLMTALGAGTLWPLLLLGMTGHLIHLRLRRWGALAGGLFLIVLGLLTGLRGTSVVHRILRCPASTGVRTCCEPEAGAPGR